MNLPFFKRINKKILPLYYLVLVLRDEKAEAVVFEESGGKAKVIGQKEEYFSSSIDDVSQEELLEKLDKAISSAESTLPENIQTQKTIFGVKESWISNDQIKKDYLAKLKKTSSELSLIPIGFLVISQAIAHFLQKEEGAPVSAILVEVNKKNVTVTLLRAGKSIETKTSETHDSIPFTVDTVLKHFTTSEILPSRIIVFNGREDLSQEFISHAWSKSLPFLHLPQITSLPYGFDAKAVLFGAATQMGFEVLNTGNTEKIEETVENANIQNLTNDSAVPENPVNEIEEDKVEEPTSYKNFGAQNFGFAKDVDVAEMEFQEPIEELNQPTSGKEEIIPRIKEETYVTSKPSNNFADILTSAKKITFSFLNFLTEEIKQLKIKKPPSFVFFRKFGILFPAISILFIGLIVSYFLFVKATITILVDPKISEQNISVLFSTTKDTDPDLSIIKGEFVTTSEEGSVSTAATGKKDIGTPAKGTVTIFNSLTENISLPQGAVLKSPQGLEFTLDFDTSIKAVASHSADETVAPEKTTANITAKQLGKESNLPSGTKFNVGSFDSSDIIAKNDNPFSGGTKKEVTVVSKNDSIRLETDIIKQLENNAKEDLQAQIGQNKILLTTFINKSLSSKSLNVKVGDEANQVTLTGTVEYRGLSYNKSDLIEFSKVLLSKDIPVDQEIDSNNIKTSVLEMKNKNSDEIQASLNIKTLLLPKIDKDKLAKELKGKSFKITESTLYKLPQITNVNIKLIPNLFFLPKNLPSQNKNIEIIVLVNG